MKKILSVLLAGVILTGCASSSTAAPAATTAAAEATVETVAAALPAPVDTTRTYKPTKDGADTACEAGVFAADCSSINASNLVDYLGRDDVLYIDLRDYSDYVGKHLRNFENIPYFAYIWNENAGTSDELIQLFSGDVTAPVATYAESETFLNVLFPKDQTIFLMCQSGGRVANLMKILNAYGYDMTKIYNVGGMGQYTDAAFASHTTDTIEFKAEVTYSFEGLTKN